MNETTSNKELIEIATYLNEQAREGLDPKINAPIQTLGNAVNKFAKSSSGSWLGYQANVYYENFNPPPPGAHFSQEWGLEELYSGMGSKGRWREYTPEDVKNAIYDEAGNPNLEKLQEIAKNAEATFIDKKADILSIISTELLSGNDEHLLNLKNEVQELEYLSSNKIINKMAGNGQLWSRDAIAVGQGKKAPPHKKIEAEIVELNNATALLVELAKISKRAAMHLSRKQRVNKLKDPKISERLKDQKFQILDAPNQLDNDLTTVNGILGVACLFIDIDEFKKLNSHYTEEIVDDSILPKFQEFIDNITAQNGYSYARGGDEIVILLPNFSEDMAVVFAKNLQSTLSTKKFVINKDEITLKVSIGIAYVKENEDCSQLIKRANKAKKKAKDNGKNQIVIDTTDENISLKELV